MSDIWREYNELQRERTEKLRELMDEWDKTIYYPRLKELRERCATAGHSKGRFHDNGFGWSWFYCCRCGGRMDVTGPDGQKVEDDRSPAENSK